MYFSPFYRAGSNVCSVLSLTTMDLMETHLFCVMGLKDVPKISIVSMLCRKLCVLPHKISIDLSG